MWRLRRRKSRQARSARLGLRDANARLRELEDTHMPAAREALVRSAEQRADELEERADRVAESLLERLHRNNFAEGIALSWGQEPARHRQGGA
jgi:hypothetical protein